MHFTFTFRKHAIVLIYAFKCTLKYKQINRTDMLSHLSEFYYYILNIVSKNINAYSFITKAISRKLGKTCMMQVCSYIVNGVFCI